MKSQRAATPTRASAGLQGAHCRGPECAGRSRSRTRPGEAQARQSEARELIRESKWVSFLLFFGLIPIFMHLRVNIGVDNVLFLLYYTSK
jgi:hypothetical protein